ncbi:MAG: hypothetical protein HWE13_00880 [Gammaproteobacteria bacterium]|nr:hypothetical protein [Gammaproteobacteria bacterium]NVK86642.1 hypothetical protein [Gammaproteobacteria bacterium]
MSPEISSIIRVIKKEAWNKRRIVLGLYIVFSFLFLAIAWNWPKVYTSSSTIEIVNQNILEPIMAGTAETTQVQSRAAMANKIIFSQKAMKKIIDSEIWAEERSNDPRKIEQLADEIRNSTQINNVRNNHIEVSYRNVDPIKAYETVKLMTDIFIEDSLAAKQSESQAAFGFVNTQVLAYHEKLKESENALKEFRSRNIDASENAKQNASERLIELKRELESVDLDISTQQSLLGNYQKQLAGESSFEDRASIDKENSLNQRIAELENRLADLKLNYHETYPDIVQLKGQIEDLKQQVNEVIAQREKAKGRVQNKAPTGETAQQIRAQMFNTENTISSLQARRNQILMLMDRERETLDKINDVEAEIAELTRDYEINQQMYQSLLSQRETARISMNIDLENQGLRLQVLEEPAVPVTPKGLRFSHLILAGLVLSFVIPIGVVYGFTLIDGKLRAETTIANAINLPVLAHVHDVATPYDRRKNTINLIIASSTILVVWTVYAIAIYFRLQG